MSFYKWELTWVVLIETYFWLTISSWIFFFCSKNYNICSFSNLSNKLLCWLYYFFCILLLIRLGSLLHIFYFLNINNVWLLFVYSRNFLIFLVYWIFQNSFVCLIHYCRHTIRVSWLLWDRQTFDVTNITNFFQCMHTILVNTYCARLTEKSRFFFSKFVIYQFEWKNCTSLSERIVKFDEIRLDSGEISREPKRIVNGVNRAFANLGVFKGSDVACKYPDKPNIPEFTFRTVTRKQLYSVIDSLDDNKAAGPGEISIRLIKSCKLAIGVYLQF